MKSQLRLVPHAILPSQQVIEIWYNGQFIGQVVGADGPGIRVISKHPMTVERAETRPTEIGVVETRIIL